MKSIGEIAETIARRGIDPTAPTQEPEPFDPLAFRVEQAEHVLGLVVPERFRHAEVTHPRIKAWVERFLTRQPGCPSLLIHGTVGTGKTHQAYGALRHIALTAARRPPTVVWRVTTHPDFNDLMRPKADDSHERAIERFLTAELVIFDDLGAGRQTDWTADSLQRLVNTRWASQLPTIYTTNLDPDVLEAMLDPRTVSRVFDSTPVALSGADRRKGGAR